MLTVRAIDDDLGVNGQITYSLNNETQWRFRIDNDSGKITTAGYVSSSVWPYVTIRSALMVGLLLSLYPETHLVLRITVSI